MNISKLFKFDWLKSEERKELEGLREEKKLREFQVKESFEEEFLINLPEDLKIAEKALVENITQKKSYKSRRVIGDNLIVVLWDGTPLQGSKDLYDAVGEAKNEKEIIGLFIAKEVIEKTAPEVETKEEKQLVRDNWEILRSHIDFLIKGQEVYLKGVSLPLPAVVAVSFIEVLEKIDAVQGELNTYGGDTIRVEKIEKLQEQYQALKMFWLKLAVNPIENSRNQLLTFCKKNDVRITSTGNLVLYRKIVSVSEADTSLVEFVSQNYERIKRWKKGPKNYFVVYAEETYLDKEEYQEEGHWESSDYDDDDFDDDYDDYDDEWVDGKTLTREVKKTRTVLKLRHKDEQIVGREVGNLEDLYLDLPNMTENSYTSQSNKGKYTIKIGEVYKIDEDELDTDANVCHGGGLHAACVTYNYGGYGDVPVVVLVNPSKALTVPYSDAGKLRTTEMFVMCINDKPLGVHYDEDGLMICDEQYNDYSIKELETVLATKDFTPLCMEDKTTEINLKDLALITETLKSRIVKV